MTATGRVFEIQRFCVHDGPGIRTTVFLKGCPLRCMWCHNPEAMTSAPSLAYSPDQCISCGACVECCPHGAHVFGENGHILDRTVCRVCGACAKACPAGALELAGQEKSVDEVMAIVVRDKPFYATSGGGMTISGGEPLFQAEFTEALLMAARHDGIHTVIETSGFGDWDVFARIVPMTDLFLYDCKETDPDLHKEFTGVDAERITSNLRQLHDNGARIILRCPIIPGHNERREHLEAIARLVQSLPDLEGIELLPYHRLGDSKVERFGLDAESRARAENMDKGSLDRCIDVMRSLEVKVLNQR